MKASVTCITNVVISRMWDTLPYSIPRSILASTPADVQSCQGISCITTTSHLLGLPPSIITTGKSILASNHNMSGNTSEEQTPLLTDDIPVHDRPSRTSTGARLRQVLRQNIAYIVLTLLLLLFLILFIVQSVRANSHSHDDPIKEPPRAPSNTTDICTSAGCVLASANILRGLSPKYLRTQSFFRDSKLIPS